MKENDSLPTTINRERVYLSSLVKILNSLIQNGDDQRVPKSSTKEVPRRH